MAKIVKFPINNSAKLGYRKVRKSRRVNLEDYGQLNMFTTPPSEARVVSMQSHESAFEQALYFDEENDEKAIEYYWKAIKAGECVADAYCNLGIFESARENYIKAIDCLTNCLKHDPRHFEAHYNLANVYSELGELNLAKLHYEISIEIEPTFESAYYNLGLVMAMQKDFKEAVKVLHKYKELASEREKDNVDKLINSLQRSMKSKAQ
ncbi:tetratricopeptide repeat protein [Fulvivirga sp. 29W222]|uniref:Tetratricopeptide repeat protein n=1 Tax=Fulvivirga marina TaxID=2494733 RepID=A0A937FZ68_9BACT|nr:tetratricopeptide repeat protein [Fulvivirga marina]MBL6445586.1 tetratricopeptide repeat protein [Fulvivirga marina]